jgi:hypothetical protein
MALDVHAGARQRTDVVPRHDEFIGVARLDRVAPRHTERGRELVEEALDVEILGVLDQVGQGAMRVRAGAVDLERTGEFDRCGRA